ncbi:SH2 domain-containing protein 2A [Galemys pyrenaicus]|uniref:SH2 domain-containing protein 2A n=1 Tax=Galemys pyrenaicus TaxID=202257 RepID=A0A8J6AEJ4_GALPY|nr:SH2 domain-containing protein 2A [Galemys pyrenaicus]
MDFPLAQIGPQGSRNLPASTFSTFQPVNLAHRSCQSMQLLPGPRVQALKAKEAQPNPRNLVVHTAASLQVPGAASKPEDTGQAEEVPREGGLSLQAETRAWFQKTQAHWLLKHGAAPTWFHGFITRREAERLLETKPQGCYLVRFSESAVTFVLTYRSRTCCRHFLLAQLGDGRHVVLGEDSAHERLQDLLWHYTACPLSPYGETLTQPLARQIILPSWITCPTPTSSSTPIPPELSPAAFLLSQQTPQPAGLPLKTEEPDFRSKNQEPHPQYSSVIKKGQPAAPTQKEGTAEPKESSQPPRPKPPIPAKPQLPPEVYASPAPRSSRVPRRPRPTPPPKPSNAIYHELDEPIAFYAMGRGSPGENPSNIYSEVEVKAPSRTEGLPCPTGHPGLQKCCSRPAPGSQNPGDQKLHSENSVAGQGPPLPHSLPHNLSKLVSQRSGVATPGASSVADRRKSRVPSPREYWFPTCASQLSSPSRSGFPQRNLEV